MIHPSFPTREQISAMTIDQIKALQINDMDEEKLVQEIVNAKFANSSVADKIYTADLIGREIKTPEEEAEVQKIIDERTQKVREKMKINTEPVMQEISAESDVPPILPEEPVADDPGQEVAENSGVFCELCDGKRKHKKDCPSLIV